MSIPALFVFGILMDRTNRADQVSQELGQLSGGPQTFLGPVLSVPYRTPVVSKANIPGQPSTVTCRTFRRRRRPTAGPRPTTRS
jgi:inner membrane protein